MFERRVPDADSMPTKARLNREGVLEILRSHKGVLKERFGVTEISLFGSFARDEANDDSDIDIVVKFEQTPTFNTYFGAQEFIAEVSGRNVDLATEEEIRKEILPYVKRDLMKV